MSGSLNRQPITDIAGHLKKIATQHWPSNETPVKFRECTISMSGTEARAALLALASEMKRETQSNHRDVTYADMLYDLSMRILQRATPLPAIPRLADYSDQARKGTAKVTKSDESAGL